MYKKIFNLIVAFTLLSPYALACSKAENGVITGGACSIAELNEKVQVKNEKIKLNQNFKKEIFRSPSQKILCKYSLCPIETSTFEENIKKSAD
ncbi:hypothetical protein KBA27_00760 [bacterium]|nr:hypothetical protein [bacterium]